MSITAILEPASVYEIKIGPEGAVALVRELQALDAGDAANEVAGQRSPILVLRSDYLRDVVRALEHIGRQTSDRSLHEGRRQLCARLGDPPLEYRLASDDFAGHEPVFVSYSGPYGKGQRLVAGPNLILRVVEVELQATPFGAGFLTVEDLLT